MLIKKIINRIVRSSGSPDKNDLWLDDNLNLKVHENEEWKTIAGGGGSGSGCSCPGVMIVEGTKDKGVFIPNSGSPSVFEAIDLLKDGGIVYLRTEEFMAVAGYASVDGPVGALYAFSLDTDYIWYVPVIVYGTIDIYPLFPDMRLFIPNDGQMSASEAKESFNQGYPIVLSYEISGETIVDNITGYSSDFHCFYTERNVMWNVEIPHS